MSPVDLTCSRHDIAEKLLSSTVVNCYLNVSILYLQTGSTALMYAAYRNHPGVVQVLLKHGADLTVQNEDEMTATDLAVGQGNTAGINFSTGLQSKPRKKGHYHNKFDMHIIKPPISFILAPPLRISNLDKLFFSIVLHRQMPISKTYQMLITVFPHIQENGKNPGNLFHSLPAG